jgi:hypothetical protein
METEFWYGNLLKIKNGMGITLRGILEKVCDDMN